MKKNQIYANFFVKFRQVFGFWLPLSPEISQNLLKSLEISQIVKILSDSPPKEKKREKNAVKPNSPEIEEDSAEKEEDKQ